MESVELAKQDRLIEEYEARYADEEGSGPIVAGNWLGGLPLAVNQKGGEDGDDVGMDEGDAE